MKIIAQIVLSKRISPYFLKILNYLTMNMNVFDNDYGEKILRHLHSKPFEERLMIFAWVSPEKFGYLIDEEITDSFVDKSGKPIVLSDPVMRAKASVYEAIRDLTKDNVLEIQKDLAYSLKLLLFENFDKKTYSEFRIFN